jgi:myo-inositol-1(or 4)-monophosphatase
MQNVIIDESLEKKLLDIVARAADIIKDSPFHIDEKDGPVNIVTTNDVACQEFLYKELSPLIPDAGFLGEESLQDLNHPYLWVIDPIDGTANYARGINECAISVALVQGKTPLLGVVHNIFTGEVFCARRGAGAKCNGKPISVSARDFSAGILCTAMSVYNKSLAKTCSDIIYDAYMECNDVRRFGGCALELCYLAAGRCDLYFEMRVFPWDYAAGYLILKEAGGELTGFGGEVLDFTKATALIGANRRDNYDKMRSLVEKHMTCIPYKE